MSMLGHREGKEIIKGIGEVVALWSNLADKYGIGSFEKELMVKAFGAL